MRRFKAAVTGLTFILCLQPLTAKSFADSRTIENGKESRTETIFNM